jgi:hypothetical protein
MEILRRPNSTREISIPPNSKFSQLTETGPAVPVAQNKVEICKCIKEVVASKKVSKGKLKPENAEIKSKKTFKKSEKKDKKASFKSTVLKKEESGMKKQVTIAGAGKSKIGAMIFAAVMNMSMVP